MNWIMQRLEKEIIKHKTNNPFEIAERKNIIIRYFPLGDTLGFYMKNARHQIITLNSYMNELKTTFVCAHELGHSILHPNENTPFLHKNTLFSKDRIEKEANLFAVSLLLWDKDLKNYETKGQILADNGIPVEMARFL